MKLHAIRLVPAVGVVFGLWGASVFGQSRTDTADAHLAVAATAGQEHLGLFTDLCAPPYLQNGFRRPVTPPQPAPPQPRPGPPDRSLWHAEPVKVFDNLYFVGHSVTAWVPGPSAWAVTTSDGIILIDALYGYSVEDEIVDGLKKLGLDPAEIKYVIVSHGHGDHSGGAKYLQDHFGARVILSAADWDLLDRGRGTKPKRDMVATDSQKLTLGDTTVMMYLTPGHTPGSISTLVPVKDAGRPHLAAAWGGTAFNYSRTPFETYATSAERFRDIVEKAGADVIISNHRSTMVRTPS